jgi:DNA-binding IclR family transcriptional regulator
MTSVVMEPAVLAPAPSAALLRRVMGEYDEMPSLRLTLPQAMRLWGLDRSTCEAVLQTLIDARFLARDRWGQFKKSDCGY